MHIELKQTRMLIILALGIISIEVALLVGISDNPPGIILSFLGGLFIVLAFTYKWRKSRSYIILLVSCLGLLVISVVLHNFLEVLHGGVITDAIGVVFFLVAIFICPAGILVGIVGGIVTALREDKEKRLK